MATYKFETDKKEEKRHVYLQDKYAIKILRDERNRDYLFKIICAATGISEKDLEEDFEIVDIRIGTSTSNVEHEADLVLKSDQIYINLEVNYGYDNKVTDNKNLSYVCELILRQQPKGDTPGVYRNLKPIYQICLNGYDRFGLGRFIYTSKIMEESTHQVRSDMMTIKDINLDFLTKIEYTNIEKYERDSLEWLLYIFVCNNKTILDEVYVGDLIMEKIKSQLYELDENLDNYLFYDREALRQEAIFYAGEEEGKKKGFEQGLEKGREELIRTMFNNGISPENISKMTSISIEKVKGALDDSFSSEDNIQ